MLMRIQSGAEDSGLTAGHLYLLVGLENRGGAAVLLPLLFWI